MKKSSLTNILLVFFIVIVIIGMGGIPNSEGSSAYPPPGGGGEKKLPAPTPTTPILPNVDQRSLLMQSSTIYLPLVMVPYQSEECGTEFRRDQIDDPVNGEPYFQALVNLPCKWLRYNWGTERVNELGLYAEYVNAGKNLDVFDLPGGAASEISKIRSAGKEPVILFMGNQTNICTALDPVFYPEYAIFVKDFVNKYQIRYIEIWNEPDYGNGLANAYGCWGIEKTQQFINLLTAVRQQIPLGSGVKIGTSFGLSSDRGIPMVQTVAHSGLLDFIGIHHYVNYQENVNVTHWQSLIDLINTVRGFYSGDLWLTETNLKLWVEEGEEYNCNNLPQEFFVQQGTYINFAMKQVHSGGVSKVFGYILKKIVDCWLCATLLDNNFNPLPSYLSLKWPPNY